MKNKFKNLLIASMCLAMTCTTIPAIGITVNPFETTTVKAEVSEKSGLYHEGNLWNYYENGEIATNKTTLVKYNGSWWYVENGKINFNKTTLCKYKGTWFYVHNGKVDFSARTLCKYNGSWFYVHNGKVDFSARTLCKYNGVWWFIEGGKINFNANTVVKYNGSWWYVHGGRVDFNANGLCKYSDSWWYIHGGKIDFNSRTLCKFNGYWWFVNNGRVDFSKQHTHSWTPVYKTVHHDAITHVEDRGYYEPKEDVVYIIDNKAYNTAEEACQAQRLIMKKKDSGELPESYPDNIIEKPVATKIWVPNPTTIVDKSAYDEQVLTGYSCNCGATK